ncbi:hypothetical protein ABFS83_04G097700 [Erythranthe nasuta]
MEKNLPIVAKKIWKMVRVIYFMLRKGISKGKLFTDFGMIMKRGKIAGKAAIKNLMLLHHHHAAAAASPSISGRRFQDYEFSCSSSSPDACYPKKRRNSKSAQPSEEDLMAAASPVLPGFGPSPNVRQLRVTDSPFPLEDDVDKDSHVDEAAEVFIMNFYKELRLQNSMGYC